MGDTTPQNKFEKIIDLIKGQNPKAIILISSHETYELEHLCDTVVFIHKGSLELCGKIEDIMSEHQVDNLEQVFLNVIERS